MMSKEKEILHHNLEKRKKSEYISLTSNTLHGRVESKLVVNPFVVIKQAVSTICFPAVSLITLIEADSVLKKNAYRTSSSLYESPSI